MKLTEKPAEDASQSAAERTFASTSVRLQLEEEEHDELARMLQGIITDILRVREDRGWDANWDLWENAYFGITEDRPMAGQANIHVPLSQEIVDTTDAALEQVLFSERIWMGVQPREKADAETVTKKEQFLDYALKVEMKAKDRLEAVRFEAAVLGTGVVHLPWLRETDRVRDEETYDGASLADMERFDEKYPNAQKDFPDIVAKLARLQKVTLLVESPDTLHDAPACEFIPLRKWIVRDTAEYDRLHREVFVGHEYDLRWDDIVRLEEEGYYDDGVTERVRNRWNDERKAFEAVEDYQATPYTFVTGILRWRRKGEKRERRYLVDFHEESRTVARILPYPYWHNRVNYIPFYYQRSRKYIYGLSLIQKIEGPQAEANATHSLVLDVLAYTATPMFKARRGVEQQFNPLRDGFYPGKVFWLDNPQTDVEQFQMAPSSGLSVAMTLESLAHRHAELASGATQNLSGIESARDPDAPASKTVQQTTQAFMRVNRYVQTFAASLVELGFQVFELYYQFSPQGKVFRVLGEDGQMAFPQITRQELRLRADLYPHGTIGALAPDKERAENFEMFEFLSQIPEIGQSAPRRLALAEIVMDSAALAWRQKKHKVLPSPREMRLLKGAEALKIVQTEQQLQMAVTQMQQGGPPPPQAPAGSPPGGPAGPV